MKRVIKSSINNKRSIEVKIGMFVSDKLSDEEIMEEMENIIKGNMTLDYNGYMEVNDVF